MYANNGHRFKSSFGQCECLQCGRYRHNASVTACGATPAVLAAIKAYAAKNGTTWKARLCREWSESSTLSQELQQARNVIGPKRLKNFTAKLLSKL